MYTGYLQVISHIRPNED